MKRFLGYGKPIWTGVFLVVLLLIQDAWGDPKGGRVQALYPGPMDMVKRQIFNELLSAETPQLSWPPFPRLWLEKHRQRVITTNTYIGLKIPIAVASGGAKLNIQFKYGLKTTFTLISSRRKAESSDPISESLGLEFAKGDKEKQMLRWDPQYKMSFPDVRDDYPMVGLCAFEASLAIDTGKTLNFEVLGSGASVEHSDIETNSHSIFSNFFQVRPDVSVAAYLDTVCDQVFRQDVEQFVLQDFSKVVIEKVVHANPKSECAPPRGPEGASSLAGDASCLDWHRKNFHRTVQNTTTARCELQKDGAHRCELRSKVGGACPIYLNSRTGTYSETRDDESRLRVTQGYLENPCDETSGLRCQLVSEPWMVWGVPLWSGKGRCQ